LSVVGRSALRRRHRDQMRVAPTWRRDINAKRCRGRKLRLIVGDEPATRSRRSARNQMANNGVVFVAGHYCSGASDPASRSMPKRILQISPASTNPALTDDAFKKAGTMCSASRPRHSQGRIAGNYLAAIQWQERRVIDKIAYARLADETRKR